MDDFCRVLSRNKMTLIMSMPVNDANICRAAFDAGADAVKVHINVRHRASGNGFGRYKEYERTFMEMLENRHGPMGLMLGGSREDAELDVPQAISSEFSFFSVYAHHAPCSLLQAPQALVAACDGTYTPDEICAFRKIGAKVIEASIIPGTEYGTPLQLRDILHYQQIVEASGLPVVVPTQRSIAPKEVETLYRIGVKGIMIGSIVTGKEQYSICQAVEAFRKAIDAL